MSAPGPALPQLVATDLDGTLLRTDGSLSERTRRALAAVEEAGMHVVVVTARPPRWVHELDGVVGRHGVVLCANGAFVFDLVRRRVVDQRTLPARLVLSLAQRLRAAVPGTSFAVETVDGLGREPAFPMHPMDAGLSGLPAARVAADDPLAGMVTGPLEDLLTAEPGKLLARNVGLDAGTFLEAVRQVVSTDAVLAYSGADGLAEISAPGVTKAAALADWCAQLEVDPVHVWAFGDMPNDVPMLGWAGRSYAVAGAHPSVLEVAEELPWTNDDDAVARQLETLLPG